MKKTRLKIAIILTIDTILLVLCVINIIGVSRKSDIPNYDKQNLVFNKDFLEYFRKVQITFFRPSQKAG